MKILLGNDTGNAFHLGCKGVSDAHARLLGRAGHEVIGRLWVATQQRFEVGPDTEVIEAVSRDDRVRELVEASDAVVVNGEGTIHHGAGRGWLALLALGQRLGKATVLTNAVIQDTPGFDKVFARLDDLCVRESRSAAYLASRGIACRVSPDSYYAAAFEPAEDYDLLDRTVMTDRHFEREHDVGVVMDIYLDALCDTVVLPFETLGAPPRAWRRLPEELACATGVITARHHGVCAAVLAGVPFVGLGGNTWKIEGHMEDLGLGDLFVTGDRLIGTALDQARARPWLFTEARERVFAEGGPDPFRALGRDGPSREAQEVERLRADLAARGVAL